MLDFNQRLLDPTAMTMVLTVAQTMAFLKNNDQMGIHHATIVEVQQEGIANVDDLSDLDKDSLNQLPDNLQ